MLENLFFIQMFTLIIPAMFTGTWSSHAFFFAVIAFGQPSLLSELEIPTYLKLWFIFESVNIMYYFYQVYKR